MELLSVNWLFPVTEAPVRDGALLIEAGRIVDLGPAPALRSRFPGIPERRLPPGAIVPGLINAHTHLELDAVGPLSAEGGFTAWVSRMIAAKEELDPDEAAEKVRRSAADHKAMGTVCVADISGTLLSVKALDGTGLHAKVFLEKIGREPAPFDSLEEEELPPEILALLPACHTPFSAAPETFRAASQAAASRGAPWCAHVAESEAETELLLTGGGPLRDLMLSRGIEPREIPSPRSRSIAYLDSIGCLDERLLAVHLVQADDQELELLARRGVTPCLCPSSNLHLVGRLPRIDTMLRAGLRPALGTDSLSSGESQSLFREMEIIMDRGIGAETALRMGTLHGAEALRLPARYGRIERGESPELYFLAFEGGGDSDPATQAVRAGASGRILPLNEA